LPEAPVPRLSRLERRILVVACRLMVAGTPTFHGYQLAAELAGGPERLPTVGYGSLYRAVDRLERIGYLGSWWEEPAPIGRPRRRRYQLTPAGVVAAPLPSPKAILSPAAG
jgi:DNA-binding PadR family transcriptional regulator